ncbi:D-alanyl-D-alanine carboxypeptidase (penicillin-binding protein 5/6) [Tistlia consotensis]|uniref:serine-type D-Ala-D-Ala carboxypeptidase n=1 Tax=Tistlia consotensis USBA 355 TaxID=560819 RepID=A0A1Y6CRY3_9PROT|nr:D-alanyl-D-alanine carboxypeptidase family protein [Tistlia consotensis]SMF68911.1 D-alanyl-D-alanine carboxypeptidase (penicillin-binding protein 5/6) [Tistlia consotensis USBA 355]SNS01587.1 D-alanyl-D-alanine carboxypeptidase (penicillin-binding protein 5/6) [Tistlia consotensis]
MFRSGLRHGLLLPLFLLVLAAAGPRPAAAFETEAREAILIDLSTHTVLYAKDPDRRIPPASMSKMMTAYIIEEAIDAGHISLDDEFLVSEKAWRKGGSKMFVKVGNKVKVRDLLQGVVVQSGNDASIVLAEGLAGSEEAFAELMNKHAKKMGLTGSHFANATGWPDPEEYMTVRDLSTLATHIIEDHPKYYPIYSETEFTWNGIKQSNRNPLLYRNIGADGLKTGHTEEAGYCLTASAVRNGRRLVLVVTGLPSVQARAEEGEKLMEWGFREFDKYDLAKAGETIDKAPVWLGTEPYVPLVPMDPVAISLSRTARPDMKVTVSYDSPIPAPIAKGQELATMTVTAPGMEPKSYPLYAGADVEKLGSVGRIVAAAKYLVLGQP